MNHLGSPGTLSPSPPLSLVYIKLLIWVHINRSQRSYRKGIPQKLTTGGRGGRDNKPIREILCEIIMNNAILNSQLKQKIYDY